MFEWLNAEGCCWSGEDFDGRDFDGKKVYDKLSKNEEKAVKELFDKCYKRYIDGCYERRNKSIIPNAK
jgi:hypothetical protein